MCRIEATKNNFFSEETLIEKPKVWGRVFEIIKNVSERVGYGVMAAVAMLGLLCILPIAVFLVEYVS
jgi:hypothetical protein